MSADEPEDLSFLLDSAEPESHEWYFGEVVFADPADPVEEAVSDDEDLDPIVDDTSSGGNSGSMSHHEDASDSSEVVARAPVWCSQACLIILRFRHASWGQAPDMVVEYDCGEGEDVITLGNMLSKVKRHFGQPDNHQVVFQLCGQWIYDGSGWEYDRLRHFLFRHCSSYNDSTSELCLVGTVIHQPADVLATEVGSPIDVD